MSGHNSPASPAASPSHRDRGGRGREEGAKSRSVVAAPCAASSSRPHSPPLSRLNSRLRCGLCEVRFPQQSLQHIVTWKAVHRLRQHWASNKQLPLPVLPQQQYNEAQVCVFCAQYFAADAVIRREDEELGTRAGRAQRRFVQLSARTAPPFVTPSTMRGDIYPPSPMRRRPATAARPQAAGPHRPRPRPHTAKSHDAAGRASQQQTPEGPSARRPATAVVDRRAARGSLHDSGPAQSPPRNAVSANAASSKRATPSPRNHPPSMEEVSRPSTPRDSPARRIWATSRYLAREHPWRWAGPMRAIEDSLSTRSPYPPFALVNPAAATPRGRERDRQRGGARLASPHSGSDGEGGDGSPLQHPSEQHPSGASLVPREWRGEGPASAKTQGPARPPSPSRAKPSPDAAVQGLRLALARGDSPMETLRQLDLRLASTGQRPHTARERRGAGRSPRGIRPATARRSRSPRAPSTARTSRASTPRSPAARARAHYRGRGSSEAGAIALYSDVQRLPQRPAHTPIRRSRADANLLARPVEYSLAADGGDQ